MLGKDDKSGCPLGFVQYMCGGKFQANLTAPYACVQPSHLIVYLPINPHTCPLHQVLLNEITFDLYFKASRVAIQ